MTLKFVISTHSCHLLLIAASPPRICRVVLQLAQLVCFNPMIRPLSSLKVAPTELESCYEAFPTSLKGILNRNATEIFNNSSRTAICTHLLNAQFRCCAEDGTIQSLNTKFLSFAYLVQTIMHTQFQSNRMIPPWCVDFVIECILVNFIDSLMRRRLWLSKIIILFCIFCILT